MMLNHLLRFYWADMKGVSTKRPESPEPVRHQIDWVRLLLAVVLIAALFLGSQYVVAGETSGYQLTNQRNVIFDRITTSDGLSQASVTAILQDRKGFIWIGTSEGLSRFNGYEFETFYHLDEKAGSLSHDHVWDLLEDNAGRLWVATDEGVNLYDAASRSFTPFYLNANSDAPTGRNITRALYLDSQGRFWIGTAAGLSLMTEDGVFRHYHHDPAVSTSIGDGGVRAIFEDSKGRLWIGTELGGLSLFDQEADDFKRYEHQPDDPYSLSDNYVRDIAEGPQGEIWVATFNRGLSILDASTGQFSRVLEARDDRLGINSNRVRTLLKDANNRMWVGTDGGLNLYNNEFGSFQSFRHDPTSANSLSDNNILDLFQDKGGVLWVGTFNGISKWNPKTAGFSLYRRDTRNTGIPSNQIASFSEGMNGSLWIGTFGGLSHWNPISNDFSAYTQQALGLSDNRIMSLGRDVDGRVWAGTMVGGINVLRDGKVEEIYSKTSSSNSLSSNAITRIVRDSDDQMWATTYGGGVNLHLGDGRFKHFPADGMISPDFPDLRTLDIRQGPDGLMYIATEGGGLIQLDPASGSTRVFRHQAGISSPSSDNLVSLCFTDTALWIGTRDRGLNRFDLKTGEFVSFTKSDGLASDSVYGILEDPNGYLWISGAKGLSRMDPVNKTFTSYDSTHGLQSDDFNSGAFLEMSDGTFVFGGANGFNAFDPLVIGSNDYVPPIRLTRFTKFNKPVDMGIPVDQLTSIDLEHGDSVIGFEFAALDFTASEKNRYQYMLQGFDAGWVEANAQRQVTYTNLDPGHYRFRVRGSNNDGVWNEQGLAIELNVNPPLWATWWAQLLYALLSIALLYFLFRVYAARTRRVAEQKYNERIQLYIRSLEEATDCVVITDAEKRIMYANNAIKEIAGLNPDAIEGQPLSEVLFSERTDAELAYEGLLEAGRWHGEIQNHRDDFFYSAEVTLAAVKDGMDKDVAFICIMRDITERKRTESELENHRRNLEFLVDERTSRLSKEIAENKAAQLRLANSLEEKELLLKEVHHRVKNNMQVISSLLNIQAESITDPSFANLLGESQQRIKSMSLIHENLYQSDNLLEIDFSDYITMLGNSLCRFYTIPGVAVNLVVDVEGVALDIDTAVPCGLIINELISNALKHAFTDQEGSGLISVRFHPDGCRYKLVISDDGKGLPAGFDLSKNASMGMEIVSILTQQLEGTIHACSEQGTRFEITFPRKHIDAEIAAGS